MSETGVREGEASTAAASLDLELRNVTTGYADTIVLRDVSIEVPTSSVVALLGPNGAGKTTLLRAAAGLNKVVSGSVLARGRDITHAPPNRRSRDGLCLIPEGRAIFRSLTVRENLLLHAPKRQRVPALDMAVSSFPVLGQRLEQVAGSLSGGEQQMLALCRAYVGNPRLVLVDEASLGLAPLIVDALFDFLAGLARRGTSLLIVDQFVARALDLADHVYVLAQGEVTFSGSPAELQQSDVFTRYLGG